MKTQVTRKKKVISIRSQAAAKAQAPGIDDEPETMAAGTMTAAAMPIPAKTANYGLSVAFALVAMVCFIVLIALQATEFSYLRSAFPIQPVVGTR